MTTHFGPKLQSLAMLVLLTCVPVAISQAQEKEEGLKVVVVESAADAKADDPQQAKLEAAFEKKFNDSTMVGSFTNDADKSMTLKQDRYEISDFKKLDASGLWGMSTRIKYGDKDITVPVAIMIKWAGDTPVITLDKLFIPGLGTFSARVLFHGDRYAGTWSHDDHGGAMFGRLEMSKK